jgi:ankyrin repeat protein
MGCKPMIPNSFTTLAHSSIVGSDGCIANLATLVTASRAVLNKFWTNGQDMHGWTPLHLAVQNGSVDLTRLLIEQGGDVTAQDNHRRTPLHIVAKNGRLDLTCLLIEHGACDSPE